MSSSFAKIRAALRDVKASKAAPIAYNEISLLIAAILCFIPDHGAVAEWSKARPC